LRLLRGGKGEKTRTSDKEEGEEEAARSAKQERGKKQPPKRNHRS